MKFAEGLHFSAFHFFSTTVLLSLKPINLAWGFQKRSSLRCQEANVDS
ncbi:hypothetical protein GBAR_LOCUS22347 [Geodia barretti]|uniref:Uncharacterized protein n=1 Tax=Geodia barretti TaxID=519541 RepID=A0AA35T2M8_GEOBA|nr:hypothetical protein GBAR_LOCUS22347 [Geodia barretti]